MQFTIETEQEVDGRWIAEIPEVPGALAYGATVDEAIAEAYVIASRADASADCSENRGQL